MLWGNSTSIWIPKYTYVNSNQHGDTYRKSESEKVNVVTLSLEACKANEYDLKQLILLGSHLDVSVKYAFSENQDKISIQLVSANALLKALK